MSAQVDSLEQYSRRSSVGVSTQASRFIRRFGVIMCDIAQAVLAAMHESRRKRVETILRYYSVLQHPELRSSGGRD